VRVADADLQVNGFAHDVLPTFTPFATKTSYLRTVTQRFPYFGLHFDPINPVEINKRSRKSICRILRVAGPIGSAAVRERVPSRPRSVSSR
jgi:hypothetical protein